MFGQPREKASDRMHHHDSLMFITFSIVAIDVLEFANSINSRTLILLEHEYKSEPLRDERCQI